MQIYTRGTKVRHHNAIIVLNMTALNITYFTVPLQKHSGLNLKHGGQPLLKRLLTWVY